MNTDTDVTREGSLVYGSARSPHSRTVSGKRSTATMGGGFYRAGALGSALGVICCTDTQGVARRDTGGGARTPCTDKYKRMTDEEF